jgi:Zinc knuckle
VTGNQTTTRPQGQDRALYDGGKFKGTCNKCGKIGHQAVDCRSNTNRNQVKPSPAPMANPATGTPNQ